MQTTYGIVGAGPNVSVTMTTTDEEQVELSLNGSGEELPPEVVEKRRLASANKRIAADRRFMSDAEAVRLFPTV